MGKCTVMRRKERERERERERRGEEGALPSSRSVVQ
jgi:hypothetical protein